MGSAVFNQPELLQLGFQLSITCWRVALERTSLSMLKSLLLLLNVAKLQQSRRFSHLEAKVERFISTAFAK